jgi:hypothetical protein
MADRPTSSTSTVRSLVLIAVVVVALVMHTAEQRVISA